MKWSRSRDRQPAQHVRDQVWQILADQPRFAEPVRRFAVDPDCGARGPKALHAASQQPADDPREHIAGSGALNGWTTPRWGALTLHDANRMDIIGVTVYPWLNYASASSVPSAYLAPLFSRIGSKPVAVTETGWPAENLGGLNPPWNTSPQEQVDFIPRFFSAIEGKDVRLVNWTFLHFMVDDGTHSPGWKLFGSVSLYDNSAVRRAAYPAWISR